MWLLRSFTKWLQGLVLVSLLAGSSLAQNNEFLPEIDAYCGVRENVRPWFQAKETVEGGNPQTAEVGPSVDFFLKSTPLLSDITIFQNDSSKSHPAVFTIGYRVLPYPDSSPTNRLEPVLTVNAPLRRIKILLSDRNRFDLDWSSGSFTWRYRNGLFLQRTWRVGSYRISPHAGPEFFYESQYSKWAETAIYAGCDFSIGHHFGLGPYYEHQNQTGSSPNQQFNQLRLILSMSFGEK